MTNIGHVSSWSILFLAGFGIVVNIGSIVILAVKGRNQMFHHMLKIMAIYDLIVVIGCGLLYSLPKIPLFPGYSHSVFPIILPFLLPVVQIAMMSSIYCTIVMSFERYIRICWLCQLKQCSYITKKNFKYYILGIVILPVMFYIPKFFEVRTHSVMWPHNERINCKNFVYIQLQLNEMELESAQDPLVMSIDKSMPEIPSSTFNILNLGNISKYHKDCAKFNFSLDGSDDFYRNVTTNVQRWKVSPTELRKNQIYYRVYCIGLNTFFASLLPLTSLMFLNVSTVLTLRKMTFQQDATQYSIPNTRSNNVHMSSPFCDERSPDCRSECRNTPAAYDERSQSFHTLDELYESKQHLHRPVVILTRSGSVQFTRTYLKREPVRNSNQNEDDCYTNQNDPPVGESQNENLSTIKRLIPGRIRRPSDFKSTRHSEDLSHQHSVVRSNQELRCTENRLTRISLCIVWLFMFCHVWKLIPTIYEGFHELNWDPKGEKKSYSSVWPDWLTAINDLSHTLIVFNSAVNFLIYITL